MMLHVSRHKNPLQHRCHLEAKRVESPAEQTNRSCHDIALPYALHAPAPTEPSHMKQLSNKGREYVAVGLSTTTPYGFVSPLR